MIPYIEMKILAVIGLTIAVASVLTGCVRNDRPMMASDRFMGTGATAPMATHAPMSPGTPQTPATSKANNIDVIKSPP
jgi:hypothetical protein